MKMFLALLGALLASFLVAGCANNVYMPAHVITFDYPLTSPGVQFAGLPPAVQNTVRAESGSAWIEDIIKATNATQTVYIVSFQNHMLYPPLYVAPDGSVLNPDLTVAIKAQRESVSAVASAPTGGLSLGDLPPQVVRAVQQAAPNAEVAFISKEVHGEQVLYLVSFKDKMHPTLVIGADGTILRQLGR